MSRCKAHTKSGSRCKNDAVEGKDYCHIHKENSDKILHPKKRAMIDALESTLGVVTTATKKVGISRQTHYQWLKDDRQYKEAVEDVDNVTLDFAESQLFKQIKAGNTTATIFLLKTRGKKRGYIEQQDSNFERIEKMLDKQEEMMEKQAKEAGII